MAMIDVVFVTADGLECAAKVDAGSRRVPAHRFERVVHAPLEMWCKPAPAEPKPVPILIRGYDLHVFQDEGGRRSYRYLEVSPHNLQGEINRLNDELVKERIRAWNAEHEVLRLRAAIT